MAADVVEGNAVIAQLLSFIRERGFEPGERLPSERVFAERFEVSRNTVREALSTLEWMRLVERRRGSGVYLREHASDGSPEALVLHSHLGLPLDPQVILQSVEVRYLLEVEAVRLACQRRTDADVAALEGILARSEEAVANGESISDLDCDFHLAIFAATGNEVLRRVVYPFFLVASERRALYFARADRCRHSHEDHRQLFRAIRDRDEAKAGRLMLRHLREVEHYWKDRLEAAPKARPARRKRPVIGAGS